jgi:hypothetical protein
VNRTELPAQSLTSVPPPVTGELDFRSLFSTHFAYVFHTLRRLGIPPRDLPDVTHDVFLQVYRRRDQFDPARPPRAWLFGFAFRVASRYRRLSYNRREQLDALPELPDPAPSVVESRSWSWLWRRSTRWSSRVVPCSFCTSSTVVRSPRSRAPWAFRSTPLIRGCAWREKISRRRRDA